MRRAVIRPVVVLLALALASLFASAEAGTFIDDAGRQVELPRRVDRVMAAGPPASVLVYALAPDKMAGWVRALSPAQQAFIAPRYRDLPVHGRLTGRGGTANLETVLVMKPDIIIDVGTVDATYASLADRVQEQTGIPYLLMDGTFGKSAESLRRIGAILGETERSEELAQYAERVISTLRDAIADIPDARRPRVYYGRGPKALETGLKGSINTAVLEDIGAINVAEQAGTGGLTTVSIEQVLAWNPEIVLAMDSAAAKSVLENPLWAGIDAVRDDRVFVPPALPFGWFDAPPGINRLAGVVWLAEKLFPDRRVFDLRVETVEFYRLFYHVGLDAAALDTLLDTDIGH